LNLTENRQSPLEGPNGWCSLEEKNSYYLELYKKDKWTVGTNADVCYVKVGNVWNIDYVLRFKINKHPAHVFALVVFP
jgi:hypothetical protein